MVLKVITKKGEECIIEHVDNVWLGLKNGCLSIFNDLKVTDDEMIDFLVDNYFAFSIIKE